MKKALIVLALILSISRSYAGPVEHPLVPEEKVEVPELNSVNIFRAVYPYKMQPGFFTTEEEDLAELPYVELQNSDGDRKVAILHPTMTYVNNEGENRFLVISEIITVDEDNNIQTCHGCSSITELYVFKEIESGFQLISSSKPGDEFGGSWGRSSIVNRMHETETFPIEKIGSDKYGFFVEHGFTNHGATESSLSLVSLNEDKPIDTHSFGVITEENGGAHDENSPLAWGYSSEYKFILSKNDSDYYPIEIITKGEKPNERGRIVQINTLKNYYFNKIKNEYISN